MFFIFGVQGIEKATRSVVGTCGGKVSRVVLLVLKWGTFKINDVDSDTLSSPTGCT